MAQDDCHFDNKRPTNRTFFRRFDWIRAVSRKVLTLLECPLRHFEVLKVSVVTLDQSSTKGHVQTHSVNPLDCVSTAANHTPSTSMNKPISDTHYSDTYSTKQFFKVRFCCL